MHSALDGLTEKELDLLEDAELPSSIHPMLARLTRDYFSDDDWFFERKFDGERVLAIGDGSSVTLKSRNDKDLSETYPEIVDALEGACDTSFVVDGELVAFEGSVTSFARLQKRMQIRSASKARASDVAVYYYVFDILHFDGFNVEALPNRTRKSLLKKAMRFESPVRYTQHRNAVGERFLDEACRKGWEGIIAKKADESYVHGRSGHWLKFKCSKGQELVIGGFTAPSGDRTGFGALLVGYYDGDALVYAGRVGTGFDDETLESLHGTMSSIERKTSPFADAEEIDKQGVTWVSPKLVGEFAFTEWTDSGKLRHPSFLGLRDDKDPKDVVREEPGARA